ncbi:MAG: HAMP domain-containing sensor histidine kinase [Bacteroidales bacterium]
MSKKTIWLVTSVLSVTLLGLFVVQGLWIRNALRINEQQFNQLINKTLDNTVKQLEKKEMVYQIVNEVDPYADKQKGNNTVINYHYNKVQQTKYSFSQYNQDKEVLKINDPDSLKNTLNINYLGNPTQGQELQSNQVFEISDKLKEDFLRDQLEPKLNADLSEKRVFVENIVNKLVQVDVGLENRINKDVIDEILQEEFAENDIKLDYEFAVLKDRDSLLFASDGYKEHASEVTYHSRLFPNDVIQKDNYLKVYLEDRNKYIFKSMGKMIVSSIFLSFIVIIGFALTTHIMFKQKRLSKVKNDFVNNMTHELKTPISTISLASQMLKDNSIPDSVKNLSNIAGIVEDETNRLSVQVEKVLKTALFDQGKIKIKPKELNLHNIIENVVKSFYLQVENQGGKIEKELNAEDPEVVVDEVHFTNVIFNLLDNAVKYSQEKPEIRVETENKNGELLFAVEDNGIGIKKKDQKKIFDQFYRVPTGNRHDVKGFGLGLNYVKKMVEEHNGTISLKSEYKKGTRFEILIPPNNQKNNGNRTS